MAVQTPPWAIQGQSHPAETFRRLVQVGLGDDGPSGVFGSAQALKVSQRSGTPTTGIDVAEGFALVKGAFTAYQGAYGCEARGVTQLAVAPGDPSNPRKDLVVARVYDSNYDGSGQHAFALEVVTGSPAAAPVDPTLPAGSSYLVLARIDVPANDVSITDAQITDLRVASALWSRPRGILAMKDLATSQSGVSTEVDLTNGTATLTTVAGRRIRFGVDFIQIQANGAMTVTAVGYCRLDGTEVGRWFSGTWETSGGRLYGAGDGHVVPSAGSHTFKVSIARTAGTGTLDVEQVANRSHFYVEDVGGVLL